MSWMYKWPVYKLYRQPGDAEIQIKNYVKLQIKIKKWIANENNNTNIDTISKEPQRVEYITAPLQTSATTQSRKLY